MTAILFPFWLTSKAFLPDMITAEDKASLLVAGLVAGLVAAFFEELGWTGFATHELRRRHGVLATGLLVGLPWCLVHSPLYLSTYRGPVPLALYVPVMAFSILLPYRVLMVWVYDHIQSVLMAMLMHLSLSASAFLLSSAAMVGVPDLIFNLVLGVTLWVVVAAGTAADRRKRSRPEFDQPSVPAQVSR
jgi:membrane protease YdiL (CAAX protease family)